MKKILIFLCCIVFFCVALVGTCSAAYDINGVTYPSVLKSSQTEYELQQVYNDLKTNYPEGSMLIVKENDVTYLYVCKFGLYGYVNVLMSSGDGSYDKYRLNSEYWSYSGNFTLKHGLDDIPLADVIATSDVIYDQNGNVFLDKSSFFPPPPPMSEVVMGVTSETLNKETLPALGGTMNILTLCGVGLMACLVVLSLFGKRSLISRN